METEPGLLKRIWKSFREFRDRMQRAHGLTPVTMKSQLGCPKCGNKLHQLLYPSGKTGGALPQLYVCRKCGYKGPIGLNPKKDSDDAQDEFRRAEKQALERPKAPKREIPKIYKLLVLASIIILGASVYWVLFREVEFGPNDFQRRKMCESNLFAYCRYWKILEYSYDNDCKPVIGWFYEENPNCMKFADDIELPEAGDVACDDAYHPYMARCYRV